MLHGLLKFDNSPILSLAKTSSKKAVLLTALTLASISISTGVVPVTVAGISNTQVASAFPGYSEIKEFAKDLPAAYRKINEGRIRQYYFTSYDGNYIQRQYGASADSVLNRWCANTYSDR